MFQILPVRNAHRERKGPKIICITCKFKGCVGNCRFETLPEPPKAA